MNTLREKIVQEALSWIGTPFEHEQCVKGVGVDCAMLLADVYNRVLGASIVLPHYELQWNLHLDTSRYLRALLHYGREVSAAPHEEYVPEGISWHPRFKGFPLAMWNAKKPLPADVAVWWFGKGWAHTTIVIDWPTVLNPMMHQNVTLELAETIGSISERCMRMRLLRAKELCS